MSKHTFRLAVINLIASTFFLSGVFVSSSMSQPIPIEDEYVLAMQVQVDSVLAFMRERLARIGLTTPNADVSGKFELDDSTPDDPYDGSFYQDLVWDTLEAIEDMVFFATATLLEADAIIEYSLTSEGVWTSGPMKGHSITSVGTYKEFSDNHGAIVLDITTENDDEDPFPWSGVVLGTLDKVKKDGILTATGSYDIGSNNDLDIEFILNQDTGEIKSKVKIEAYYINASFTNKGKVDDKLVKYRIQAIPEPTTMLLFGTGVAGLAAVGRRRKK